MERTQSHRRPWALASLAFLAFGGWQTATTLSRTPALNRSLQVETARGGGITSRREAMFNRADYHYWVAQGWHGRTGNGTLPGEDGSAARAEAVRDVAERARASASESLLVRPGNPETWLMLASAETLLGDGRAALQAWQRSQDVAPRSVRGALGRVYFLIGFMAQPDHRTLALATLDPAAVAFDLQVMRESGAYQETADNLSSHPIISAFGEAGSTE